MGNRPLLIYFGHHKCATVWIHSILTGICKHLSLKLEYVHSQRQFNGDMGGFVKKNDIDFLTYTNADIDFIPDSESFRGFHVIRDPRDIAVSSYFSHFYSHPTDDWPALARHREKLREVSKDEGLLLDMEFIDKDVFKRLEKWNYTLPHVLEVKMEELTRQPNEKFVQIAEHLGILDKESLPSAQASETSLPKILLKDLKNIIHKKRFAALSGGRKPGQEEVGHHFRKGTPGDWLNHFNDRHKTYFKEKYSDLLIKLGYEENTDW